MMADANAMLHQPRVLCVDDESHVLRALNRVLTRFGCRVLEAGSAAEALEILAVERVEVLICDEAMPGMRGVELLRKARAVSPGTVRVLLTAHCCDEDVVVPAVNQGQIFRLLAKPWDDEEVRQVVTDALGASPQAWREHRERTWSRFVEAYQTVEVRGGQG